MKTLSKTRLAIFVILIGAFFLSAIFCPTLASAHSRSQAYGYNYDGEATPRNALRASVGLLVLEKAGYEYDLDSRGASSNSKKRGDTNGLGGVQFALRYETGESQGWLYELGLNLQSDVHVPGRAFSDSNDELSLPNANGYVEAGYRLDRFSLRVGLQTALYTSRFWHEYEVKPLLGGRIAAGFQIADNFIVEGVFGSQGFELTKHEPWSEISGFHVDSSYLVLKWITQ